MSLPSWLPEPISKNNSISDIKVLTAFYYSFYKKDLLSQDLSFDDKPVIVKSNIFNCDDKFLPGLKNCYNTLFTCLNCVYNAKEEMFCHIISQRNNCILANLKPRFRKKERSRVPGILKKERLEKVRWIRHIIEEQQRQAPKEITCFDEISPDGKERIIYFWLKQYSFLVIIGENLWDKKQKDNLYLKTAFVIDEKDTLTMLYRKHKEYKKRSS